MPRYAFPIHQKREAVRPVERLSLKVHNGSKRR